LPVRQPSAVGLWTKLDAQDRALWKQQRNDMSLDPLAEICISAALR
jgi:hypothetical protein